jgi:hypothetical protein
MLLLSRNPAQFGNSHLRMTAVHDLLGGICEVPKETSRSLRKAPPTPTGRQRQFETFGCSRSIANLSP